MTKRYLFKIDKLVRDKMSDNLRALDVVVYERVMDDTEYAARLKSKLIEEAQEVIHSVSVEEFLEESADILEVIYTMAKLYDVMPKDIEAKRLLKKEARGGFEKKIYNAAVAMTSESKAISYYVERKEMYPEITHVNEIEDYPYEST